MNDNKKILICQFCKYFPTKADSSQIKILKQTIEWLCNACLAVNQYLKHQCVVLPKQSCLSISKENILSPLQKLENKRYFIVIMCNSDETRALYKPHNCQQLQKMFRLNFSLLSNTQKMEEQSSLFKKYNLKLKSFSKFNKNILKNNQRELLLSEYKIYLLDLFLKNQAKISGNSDSKKEIKIQLLLVANNRSFSFHFNNLDLMIDNHQLEDFLIIYALSSDLHYPQWLIHHYNSIIYNHEWNHQIQGGQYSILLISDSKNKRKDIYLGTNVNNEQITFILDHCDDQEVKQSVIERLEQYDISPLSDKSFHKYLNDKNHQSINQAQEIIVFVKQRRKSQIKSVRLVDNLKVLKELILNQKNQSLLEQQIQKIIQTKISSHTRLDIIKLVAVLQHEHIYSYIMFTFNWSKIEQQFLELTLEDPVQQNQIFRQDIYPEQNYIKIVNKPNPFSKKSKYQEIKLNISDEQQNEDDYICL